MKHSLQMKSPFSIANSSSTVYWWPYFMTQIWSLEQQKKNNTKQLKNSSFICYSKATTRNRPETASRSSFDIFRLSRLSHFTSTLKPTHNHTREKRSEALFLYWCKRLDCQLSTHKKRKRKIRGKSNPLEWWYLLFYLLGKEGDKKLN